MEIEELAPFAYSIIKATPELISKCYEIRISVFVDEQNCNLENELDDKDALSTHFLLFLNSKPVGTCRLVPDVNEECHLGRLAILKEARGLVT